MPMLDAYIPDGALDPDAEKQLMGTLTNTLLKWEGADPDDERARSIGWVFLHRPATVYVAGEPAESDQPRYRIVASVPEGQLDNELRKGMIAEITQNVLDAEPEGREPDPVRVWVFANQIPEGSWGGAGHVFGLAEIAGFVLGDAEAGKAHAKKRLAVTKAERDAVFA